MSKLKQRDYNPVGQLKTFLASMVLAGSAVAVADDTDSAGAPAPKNWTGQSELGFVSTAGNTDTQTVNAKLKLVQNLTQWENTFSVEALNASESDETSAERYQVNGQVDRRFDEKNFLFGRLNYEEDRFSGFDFESTATLGYGRQLIKTQTTSWDFEVGPGVRVVKPAIAPSEDEGILRLSTAYQYKFGSNSMFDQTLSVDGGDDRVITRSITSLTSKINNSLAMKVTLTVRQNSEPAQVTNDKTDTETAVTLVYGF